MIKIIKERTPEVIIDYYIEFRYKDDPNAGFCFPALKNGEPDFKKMPEEAILNYNSCLNDDRLDGPEFTRNKRTYMSPAVGECVCGREVILDCGHGSAVPCECGRWYNLFGQSLIDPKYWYEDEDEYYSDMPEEN